MMIQGPTSDASHHLLRLTAGQDDDWNGAILTLNHSNDRGIAIYGGRSTSNRSWGSVKAIDNVGRVSNCISMVGGSGAGVNRIEFYTGESTTTTERLRINEDGKVGIGTNNPATILHLENDAPVLTVKATNASSGFRINVKRQISGQLLRIQDDKSN